MLCSFSKSKFKPDAFPILSSMLDSKSSNNSIDMLCRFLQSSATSLKRRCYMFHFNSAKCTSISPARDRDHCNDRFCADQERACTMASGLILFNFSWIFRTLLESSIMISIDCGHSDTGTRQYGKDSDTTINNSIIIIILNNYNIRSDDTL